MRVIKQYAQIEACPTRGDALILLEAAGRTCYKSESKADTAAAFVASIIRRGHLSVIEHCSATLRLVTDRGVTHELVRHRVASYSQESTRYCNYSADKFGAELTFIEPVRFATCSEERRANWTEAMLSAERNYLRALEFGDVAQEARDILPNSLKTEIVMTANFREWLHVFELRTSKAAHPQMRALMIHAKDLLAEHIPEVFA